MKNQGSGIVFFIGIALLILGIMFLPFLEEYLGTNGGKHTPVSQQAYLSDTDIGAVDVYVDVPAPPTMDYMSEKEKEEEIDRLRKENDELKQKLDDETINY